MFLEIVHPDHNCYFSPGTLQQFLGKHGYEIIELCGYAFYPYYYINTIMWPMELCALHL